MYIFWFLFHLFWFIFHKSFPGKPALVMVMACLWISKWPFPQPMIIQFTDVYMHHQCVQGIQHWNSSIWIYIIYTGRSPCCLGTIYIGRGRWGLTNCNIVWLLSYTSQQNALTHCPLGNGVVILNVLSLSIRYHWSWYVTVKAAEIHRPTWYCPELVSIIFVPTTTVCVDQLCEI